MMEKYKICPSCGAKNPPNRIECDQCEADITGVPVTADIQGQATPAEAKTEFVRICDCGAYNLPQARRCSKCGEDISDIIAVELKEEMSGSSKHGQLTSVDGTYFYELCEKDLILGRNHDMGDYLNSFSYVSRTQARLFWQEDQLLISNLSHTNPTYINNKPLEFDQSSPLFDGDEIGLGGCVIEGKRQDQAAYFIVHLPQKQEE